MCDTNWKIESFIKWLMQSALISLFACSDDHTSINGSGTEEGIQFKSVVKVMTKGEVITTDNILSFKVNAALTGDSFESSSTRSWYMEEVEVSRNDNASSWGYSPKQKWPGTGLLSFFAYAPVNNRVVSSVQNVESDVPILTFEVAEVGDEQIDLVVAKAMDKSGGLKPAPVQLEFAHALTKVQLALTTDASYLGEEVQIKSVRWGETNGNSGAMGLISKSNYSYVDGWLTAEDSERKVFSSIESGGITITGGAAATSIGDVMMFIPQDLGRVYLTIKYSVNNGVEQTFSANLGDLGVTWEQGKVLTYVWKLAEQSTLYTYTNMLSSNCYLLPPGGYNQMIPLSRVNKAAATFGLPIQIYQSDEVVVDVLWSDNSSLKTHFDNKSNLKVVTIDGERYIAVKSPPTGSGNVLITAKVNGSIRWSWHLWVTDFDPDVNSFTVPSGLIAMDKNLGQIGNAPSSTVPGLYYQWGRKDPFVNSDNSVNNSGTILQSIQNPSLRYNSNNDDWAVSNSTGNTGNDRWGNGSSVFYKTLYDPCPIGWRVPSGSNWSGFDVNSLTILSFSDWRVYKVDGKNHYFEMGASWLGIFTHIAYYWSAYSSIDTKGNALYFGWTFVNPSELVYKKQVGFVRCVRDLTQNVTLPDGSEYEEW